MGIAGQAVFYTEQFSLIWWIACKTSFLCGILPQNNATFWVYAALYVLMGASGNLYNNPYIAYMQETIPKDVHGRVFSVMSSLMSATMPLGLVIAGTVAEIKGVASWFLLLVLLFLKLQA